MERERIQDFLKPNPNAQTYQGVFHPINTNKYIGDTKQIYYRSGWEFEYYKWLDRCDAVIRYSIENVKVQYISPLDQKKHFYYIDVFMETKSKYGGTVKWLIEIKPQKYTLFPQLPKKKTEKAMKNYYKTYNTTLVNIAKFKAASNYAKNIDALFGVVSKDKATGVFKTVQWNESMIGLNPKIE